MPEYRINYIAEKSQFENLEASEDYLVYHDGNEDLSITDIFTFVKEGQEAAKRQAEFLKKQTDLFGEKA